VDTPNSSTADHDRYKGAIEEDQIDPNGRGAPGLDDHGMPDDAIAIAQDAFGAREDNSQG